MRKQYYLLFFIVFTMFNSLIVGQKVNDAFLYSNPNYRSTSRLIGLGNAMGAIGGDVGVANINPAGLARKSKPELTLSTHGYMLVSQTEFGNNIDTTVPAIFVGDLRSLGWRLGNLSMLITVPIQEGEKKFKEFSMGISFNRTMDFKEQWNYSGQSFGSILQHFAAMSNGNSPASLHPFSTQMAYDAHLIRLIDSNNFVYASPLGDNDLSNKLGSFVSSGRNYALGLSAASNYENKLWIGSTLEFNFLNHKNTTSYSEYIETGQPINDIRTDWSQIQSTRGFGVNLKIGMIYQLNRYFTVAAHIHSPTFYRNRDTYTSSISGSILHNGWITQNYLGAPKAKYKYSFFTPWTLGLSTAFQVDKKFFINIDLERVDYRQMHYYMRNGQVHNQDALNSDINNTFEAAYRLRIGTEYIIGPKYRFSFGYQLQSNPYTQNTAGITQWDKSIHAGIRQKLKEMGFVHFGLGAYLIYKKFSPYPASSISNNQVVNIITTFMALSVSFGMEIE